MGQALDISNAVPENSPITVVGTDYSEIKNSEVIVISASVGTYMKSRMDILSEQIIMIRDIANKIKSYAPDAKILVISNPVDILTYVFQKEIELPRESVIGVSSSLDSARFRYLLARELDVKSSEIKNALVLGEHGDSMVPIFSVARLNSKPVLEMLDTTKVQRITKDLQDYWKTLRRLKGPSVFGIAKNTIDIVKAIIKNEDISVSASVLLKGEYDLSDVCLGVPVKINKKGIVEIQQIKLEKSEIELLDRSAKAIRSYITKQTCQSAL